MYQPYSLRVEAKRFLIYDLDKPLIKKCRGCGESFKDIGSVVTHEHKCSFILEGVDNPVNATCYSMANYEGSVEKNFRGLLEDHVKLKEDHSSLIMDIKLLRTEIEFRDMLKIHSNDERDKTINSQRLEIKELGEKLKAQDAYVPGFLNDNDRKMINKKIEIINHMRKNGEKCYKDCCNILDEYTNIESIKKDINAYKMLIKILTAFKDDNIDAKIVLGLFELGKTLDEEFKYRVLNHYKNQLTKLKEEIIISGDDDALKYLNGFYL